jgi:hypothetical protein
MMQRIAAVLLLACTSVAQDDEEWASGIGQRDQVTKGLVSYWSMRNSGTTVFDEWSGNNGTTYNSPTSSYSSGLVGNGMSLVSGSSHYIIVPHSTLYQFGTNTSFAISLWLKTTATNSPTIIQKRNTGSFPERWDVGLRGNGRVFAAIGQDADQIFTPDAGASVIDGAWRHVIVVFSRPGVIAVYIDGVYQMESGAITASINPNNTNNVYIGARQYEATLDRFLNASTDEIRIYNRAITIDEIKQLYRMGKIIYDNR